MQFFSRLIGFKEHLYWSYIGVVRVGCAGGVARPLAAVGRRTGQVSGRAERGWSFWAWLVALARREGRGQAQKPSHRGGRGAMELLEFLALARCVGQEGGKRSKTEAQQSRGSRQLKPLKFLKFLL